MDVFEFYNNKIGEYRIVYLDLKRRIPIFFEEGCEGLEGRIDENHFRGNQREHGDN